MHSFILDRHLCEGHLQTTRSIQIADVVSQYRCGCKDVDHLSLETKDAEIMCRPLHMQMSQRRFKATLPQAAIAPAAIMAATIQEITTSVAMAPVPIVVTVLAAMVAMATVRTTLPGAVQQEAVQIEAREPVDEPPVVTQEASAPVQGHLATQCHCLAL